MRTTKIYLIISLIMIMLHSLNGQNTADYWDIKSDRITIKTCNESNLVINTETITITDNTFYYNNMFIYTHPETNASYLHGKELFMLMKDSLRGISSSISVKTVVCLIISDTGKIVDIGIVRSSGEFALDLRAVNFLKNLSPDLLTWTPAYKNGKPVNSTYYIPLTFYGQ